MIPLDHCFVDQLIETVQIFDVGLDTAASSLEAPYQRSEVSNTEELTAHFQQSREYTHTCRVMLVALSPFIPYVCG